MLTKAHANIEWRSHVGHHCYLQAENKLSTIVFGSNEIAEQLHV